MMVPADPLMVTGVPSPLEPFALLTPMDTVAGVDNVREATTPFGMAVVFIPYTMQTVDVVLTLHPMVLPAGVKAAPPDTWMPVTVAG